MERKRYLNKLGKVINICTLFVFILLSMAIAEQNFDEEFNKAGTSEQLETLLKKYSNEGEKIIPKLESTIISEIKSKGVGNRFIIKEMTVGAGSSGSVTLQEAAPGLMMLSMEFPGDSTPVSMGGSNIPLGDGSIHRFVGKVELDAEGNTVIGEGDKLNRLSFCLIKDIGYVYLRGKGKVLLKNKKEVTIGY